ncbi:GNAT family N-acetyltransferase [Arthrobacter sp. MYb227]|nr:GNAT family N-acetyltransferase [Arthrobacter sp. MYb227]
MSASELISIIQTLYGELRTSFSGDAGEASARKRAEKLTYTPSVPRSRNKARGDYRDKVHNMLLRTEELEDRPAISKLVARAFADQAKGGEPGEVALLEQLYACDEYIQQFSVVALVEDQIVGHVIATRGWLDGDVPLLGLGPIAVDPEFQGKGIGGALLNEIRDRAIAAGERGIILLGHTTYYPRFGYVPAIPAGIIPSDVSWGDHFMALQLGDKELPQGKFIYAAPFGV